MQIHNIVIPTYSLHFPCQVVSGGYTLHMKNIKDYLVGLGLVVTTSMTLVAIGAIGSGISSISQDQTAAVISTVAKPATTVVTKNQNNLTLSKNNAKTPAKFIPLDTKKLLAELKKQIAAKSKKISFKSLIATQQPPIAGMWVFVGCFDTFGDDGTSASTNSEWGGWINTSDWANPAEGIWADGFSICFQDNSAF